MSSSAVVLVGMFVLVLLLWIERRKKFSGPKLDWDELRTNSSWWYKPCGTQPPTVMERVSDSKGGYEPRRTGLEESDISLDALCWIQYARYWTRSTRVRESCNIIPDTSSEGDQIADCYFWEDPSRCSHKALKRMVKTLSVWEMQSLSWGITTILSTCKFFMQKENRVLGDLFYSTTSKESTCR